MHDAHEVEDRSTYGAREVAGLVDGLAYHRIPRDRTVYWTEPGLRITRLRLLSDPGFPFWDVSYCHGILPSGEEVRVELPFSQLRKRGASLAAQIVAYAKDDGVFARGIGVLDNISTLC